MIQDEFSHIPDASKRWRLRNPEKVKENTKKHHKRYQELYPERYLYSRAKNHAKDKNIPFSLTLEDIKIPVYCPVLGIKLKRNAGGRTRWGTSPSIDRINSKGGYTPDNICVISWRANDVKGNATVSEIEKVLHYMKEHATCAG